MFGWPCSFLAGPESNSQLSLCSWSWSWSCQKADFVRPPLRHQARSVIDFHPSRGLFTLTFTTRANFVSIHPLCIYRIENFNESEIFHKVSINFYVKLETLSTFFLLLAAARERKKGRRKNFFSRPASKSSTFSLQFSEKRLFSLPSFSKAAFSRFLHQDSDFKDLLWRSFLSSNLKGKSFPSLYDKSDCCAFFFRALSILHPKKYRTFKRKKNFPFIQKRYGIKTSE